MTATSDVDRENKMLVRIAVLALSIGALAQPARAEYPERAIKMIVPFAAGGGTDVIARIIAQNLNSKWGQPVVVENQPLERFSRYVVFEPGDLIAMGAPSGVAVGQPNAAELYLQPGDDMVISFEGLMSLRTRIVAPNGASKNNSPVRG